MSSLFVFDKSAFEATKGADQSNDFAFWIEKSIEERLEATYFLNSAVFGFTSENEPRFDKSAFSARKRS